MIFRPPRQNDWHHCEASKALSASALVCSLNDFSSYFILVRAPLAGSDVSLVCMFDRCNISIHAPLAGSDCLLCLPHVWGRFQSTLPSRGATVRLSSIGIFVLFQSTLPSRGATHPLAPCLIQRVISIHAPLAGSDSLSRLCPIS